jgi:hypothetical protein
LVNETLYEGDPRIPDVLPCTQHLPSSCPYLYFATRWHANPANVDVALWWRDDRGKCRYRCTVTGYSFDELPHVEMVNKSLDCKVLDDLLEQLVKMGIMEMRTQPQPRSTRRGSRLISIRLPNGTSHTYRISGIFADDPRQRAIEDFILGKTEGFVPSPEKVRLGL